MKMEFTTKEQEMLVAFVETGIHGTGVKDAGWLLNNNMTWMNADDLADVLKWDKQTIGGVMASLSEKNAIFDSGESPRGAKVTDWFVGDSAINWYFKTYKAEEK
tara:strand:+ start:131 stop:442 length:312 start_codon:yes stop_codon:yes gene_type:complete